MESETKCPRPPYTTALTAAPTKSYSFAVAPLIQWQQPFGESAGGRVAPSSVAPIERSDDTSNDRYGVSVSRLEKDAW